MPPPPENITSQTDIANGVDAALMGAPPPEGLGATCKLYLDQAAMAVLKFCGDAPEDGGAYSGIGAVGGAALGG